MDVRRSDSGEIGKSKGDEASAAKKKGHQISAASDQAAGSGGRLMACSLSRWRSKEGGLGGLYQRDYLAGLEEVEIADRI